MGDQYLRRFLSLRDINLLAEETSKQRRARGREFIDQAEATLTTEERKEFNKALRAFAKLEGTKDVDMSVTIASPAAAAALSSFFFRGMHRILAPNTGELIAQSLVAACVSSFEVLVGDIAREAFKVNKTALSKSDYEFTLEELSNYDSIEEARAELVNRRVDSLLLGSVDDWSKWCERVLQLDLPSIALGWPETREIFARRNIIVHNEGKVNRRYRAIVAADNARAAAPGAIDELTTDSNYVACAIERILALGMCLVYSTWAKLYPRTAVAAGRWIVSRQESLIYEEMWLATQALTNCLKRATANRVTVCESDVNSWLARARLHGPECIRQEVQDWDTSGLEVRFLAYKALLLGDVVRADELVSENIGAHKLTRYEVLTHPIYAELRESHPSYLDIGPAKAIAEIALSDALKPLSESD
jgi:hypothetical protein